MPIYEYQCLSCGKKNEFITFRVSEEISPLVCTHCGGISLKKLVSRVRVRLSEESRLEKFCDPSRWGHIDENDPKSVANFMKTLGREIGEGAETDDIDSIIEETMENELSEDKSSLRTS